MVVNSAEGGYLYSVLGAGGNGGGDGSGGLGGGGGVGGDGGDGGDGGWQDVLLNVTTPARPVCVRVSIPALLRSDRKPLEGLTALQAAMLSAHEYCGRAAEALYVPKTGSVKPPLSGQVQSTVTVPPAMYSVGCVVHTVAASFHALQVVLSPVMYG